MEYVRALVVVEAWAFFLIELAAMTLGIIVGWAHFGRPRKYVAIPARRRRPPTLPEIHMDIPIVDDFLARTELTKPECRRVQDADEVPTTVTDFEKWRRDHSE